MEAIKTIGTMGYDPGDPNAVHPLSTSADAVFLDKDGREVGADDPNRLTKVSRFEFEARVKAGTAAVKSESKAVPFDAAQRNPELIGADDAAAKLAFVEKMAAARKAKAAAKAEAKK